ncbi:hypothetical protein BAE44_0020119 [Dichanthelium oligosanthes]|uniref:Uncharacterized protein n=1 Tax=Dichanthelium oligosanthes TaxID=888268 RepID=A0A1E5V128_9POAL|nr:hypothetical protein BAE44_0020119 [Dichanthelium oligosanthes]
MAPAAAEEDVALAAASGSGQRRGGQRKLVISWGTVFCFGSRHERGEAEEGTPWERSRRRSRRTVPVDGDLVPGTAGDGDVMMRRGAAADDKEARKGLRLQGCCFLPPARASGRKHSTMDNGSSTHNKQRQLEHTKQPQPRSPSGAPAASRIQATDGGRPRRAERPRGAPVETRAPTTRPCGNEEPSTSEASARGPSSAGVGAFGPVVGLCVVTAVSLAGLLGGRLWAMACVCAWLAALSRLRQRREARAAVAHVDSTDYKKHVVLRGLLERDRAKAVKA